MLVYNLFTYTFILAYFSVLSKYGVHSFPSILLVNGTSRVRYRGRKNILSLVRFYNRITGKVLLFFHMWCVCVCVCGWSCSNEFCLVISGLKPIPYYNNAELVTIESVGRPVIQLAKPSSPNNILKSDPLLAFSFVFVCLRVAMFKLPHVLHQLNNLCRSCVPHLNLEIFGETRQLMGRILQMLDIRRAWAKLRLYKTKNIHKGARNARVWASSLASVSLGESSSSRST